MVYIYIYNRYLCGARLMLDEPTLISRYTQFTVTFSTPKVLCLSVEHALCLVVMATVQAHNTQYTV